MAPSPAEPAYIDTHLHLWDLSTGDYAWNTPELGPLHRDVTASDVVAVLRADGAHGLLVQAADTAGDTRRMLAAQSAHDEILGVVGWVPLEPEAVATTLEGYDGRRLVGVRQLLHDHPDAGELASSASLSAARLLARAGLVLEVPDAWPRLWPALEVLLERVPELTVVVDHLGKPQAALLAERDGLARWRDDLRRVAAHPQVLLKVSGLGPALGDGVRITPRRAMPFVETVLEVAGPGRTMIGSDWPVCEPHASHAETIAALRGCLQQLPSHERDLVLRGNAQRVYGLQGGLGSGGST